MILALEQKKLKRTGFFPAFFIGGLLAASFPILNTVVRPEQFVYQDLPALHILIDANWQMIAMLNLFFLTVGSCIIYHTEFAGRAMQKMETLPQRMGTLFAGKTVLLIASFLFAFLLETASLVFCAYHWFLAESGFWREFLQIFGYELALFLPASVLVMVISSLCPNMWVSLGINVICVFVATMLPTDHLTLSLFPFAMPFQTLTGAENPSTPIWLLLAAGVETVLFGVIGTILTKVRRNIA